ncbi:MAG: prepilin-type N-terminal cleavage/methylation domain-containing protein [Chthoniobacterales bacterium]|nr:prepilin-type N-terminal cleavage/methylation domain-containing protein [Chthoniobacterales bacterium]
MNSSPSTPARSAFTLMELLIVIAIIGILMSLLFPAANSAIDAAKKAQAKNDVVQIATAVIAYETEYGRLPDTNGSAQDVSGNWLAALGGTNAGSLNPRQIVFIEQPTAKGNPPKKGVSGGTWYDPWGAKYRIAFDDNYDNTIASAGDSKGITASSLRKKVAVWNDVSGMANTTDAQKKRRAVVSWE